MEATGAYRWDRAAALSGVPRSTVYQWARSGLLVPSVSKQRVQLWSYADLMGLRILYWLRQPKRGDMGYEIPATSMPAVRRALDGLKKIQVPLWANERCPVVVDRGGNILVKSEVGLHTPQGQVELDLLHVVAPFSTTDGVHGPDLVRPRPALRIIPDKLSGSPHIDSTRLETCALSALYESGFSSDKIKELYPYLEPNQISDSLDLEGQLRDNLMRAA